MRSVDPRHLLQFHEIIRTGSFTRAAITLGLTQPALTRNMKLMEGRLGFELMVRSRQGIIPTTLGARILEEANAIVLAERRISALTNTLKRGYEAELRVGCTPTLSLHALAQPVADFARDNPAIRLDMRQAHSGLLADMLRGGLVDVVLGPPEIATQVPASRVTPLFDSRVVILASRYHPLAGRSSVTTEDLDNARWALHQPGTGIRDATDTLLRQLGDHLAVVPRYVLKNTNLAGELVQIAGDVPRVALGHAAIRTERPASGPIDRFIASMQSRLTGFDGV
jgi:DNA-binding transcriptional LysR family regulator